MDGIVELLASMIKASVVEMSGIVELLASMIKASVVLDDEEKIELTVPSATTFMGSCVVYDMIRYYLSISTCLNICIF
jgi:hypothetical protein